MRSTGLSLDQAPPVHIPFRFFMTAPFFGIFVGGLIFQNGETLFQNTWSFDTIALTHLMTLGWVMMIMMGALYQMVPVLVGGQVPWMKLSSWVHGFLIIGIISLVGGLLHVSSISFSIAVISMLIAFTIFLTQLLTALFKVEARPVIIAMRISLLSLTVAVLLGLMEVGTFAGFWDGLMDRKILKILHVTYALIGAVGSLIIGVGFHVIPMFYLSSAFPENRARLVIHLGFFSLLCIPLSLLINDHKFMLFLSTLPGFLASIIFGFTIWQMLAQRKRKIIDPTLRFWLMALPAFPLALLCLIANLFWSNERWLFAFAMLFIFGFAVNISNGMLYKIVPFLIWFHRFSSLVGIVKVPLMKNIMPESRTSGQMKLSIFAMSLLFIGVLFQFDWMIRIGGAFWLMSSAWLSYNLMSALRLKPQLPEELSTQTNQQPNTI